MRRKLRISAFIWYYVHLDMLNNTDEHFLYQMTQTVSEQKYWNRKFYFEIKQTKSAISCVV